MNLSGYHDLKTLQKQWKGKVCLFGTGLIGCTWGYDLVEAAGFCVDFYCDNKKNAGEVIRDGIKTVLPEDLYSLKDDVLVFITAGEKYQQEIKTQLDKNGIHHSVKMSFAFLQSFMEELTELGSQKAKEQFQCIVDDAEYLRRQFQYRAGYPLDLENPRTFNEKIQWLKLYDRNPAYIRMVDKYEVKKYVSAKAGREYVIPTYGVYDNFDEIQFDKLPDQFVLKCTHDSGSVVICSCKSEFDMDEARHILERGLKRNFYWHAREWPYKGVKPRIIAEKYMTDESGRELKDYKVFNFNGRARLIQVDYDRFAVHKRNLYTTDWKYVEAVIKYPTDPERQIERPKNLEKMIEVSQRLAAGIPHVRVDMYLAGDKIYFGEMTFHHGAGYEKFDPEELGLELGKWIEIRGGVK